MRETGRNMKAILALSCALGCIGLVFVWPGLQQELRAQGYTLFGPTISIDICEVDATGAVHVGGRLGEDGRTGESVSVSRGNQNQGVATVFDDGTFEGRTTPGFGIIGNNVTIGIRKTGGQGTLMSSCQLRSTQSQYSTVPQTITP